jgi:hypothetical protein
MVLHTGPRSGVTLQALHWHPGKQRTENQQKTDVRPIYSIEALKAGKNLVDGEGTIVLNPAFDAIKRPSGESSPSGKVRCEAEPTSSFPGYPPPKSSFDGYNGHCREAG